MKLLTQKLPLLIALVALLFAAASCGKNARGGKPSNVDYYTCTMHPSVKSQTPGKCPICSMDLTPVKTKYMGASERQGVEASGTSNADAHSTLHATDTQRPEEFLGATFSISNLGMFGIDEFTAVINPPEGAILAVGAMSPQPVVRNNEVVVRQMMRVTMSCDHRVIDGATGAKFLQTFKKILENPLFLVV